MKIIIFYRKYCFYTKQVLKSEKKKSNKKAKWEYDCETVKDPTL